MTTKRAGSVLVRGIFEVAVIATAVWIGLQAWSRFGRATAESPSDVTTSARDDASSLGRLGMREGPAPLRDTPGWEPPQKVVIVDMWPGRTRRLAEAVPNVEVIVVRDAREAVEAAVDADAVLGVLTPELLAAGTRLRWVQLPAAGVERYLTMPGLADSDLVLTNAQRIFAPGGAEHVLAMVLALTRRLPLSLDLQSRRRWDVEAVTGPSPYVGDGSELLELRDRTMLVAGLGGIGTETARIAHGLGMRVTATRNSSREGPPFVDYVGLADELLRLAGEADVVVNTLPLTAATERIFDEEMFQSMKPGAYFVNIGRGRTVDTEALVRALRDGRLAGAGLDVTEPEPLPPEHELWGLPNVIITPHIGGDSDRHMERMYRLFEENLRRFAVGDALLSVVDRTRGY